MFDLKYRPNPPAPPAEAPETRRRPVRRAAACAAAVLLAFAGAANADSLAGAHADASVADQIFQSDSVSAGSVAAFARNGETVGTVDGSDADPLTDAGNSADIFEPSDLRGQELSNTIGATSAAGNGSKPAGKKAAALTFWEDAAAADASYAGVSAESAAAAAAAVAAGVRPRQRADPPPRRRVERLSVMGGVGALAGFRKLRQRLR